MMDLLNSGESFGHIKQLLNNLDSSLATIEENQQDSQEKSNAVKKLIK